MSFAGNDSQILVLIADVDKPVFFINAAAVSFTPSQSFGSAYARHETIALNILYQRVDAVKRPFVRCQPFQVLFPSLICKAQGIHF
jgi:hypothetical protein